MSHHNTILSQMLKLIPRHEFDSLSQQHDGKRRLGALSRWSQFVAMFTCQVSGLSSLRDIESTLQTQKQHHYHLASQTVSRSALGRANGTLDYQFFVTLFGRLYARCANRSPKQDFGLKEKLFSLDASLIDVSMKLFPTTNYNRMKAAFKLHVGLDHDGLIPAFIAVTAGKVADQTQAKLFKFPKGSVVVFDKGYASYDWHASLAKQGVSYVTRMRDNAKFKVTAKHDVEKNSPILSDETIEYTSLRASKKQLIPVRRIVFHDAESDRDFVFTTNRFDWSASLVAQVYKQRWQVELFFKWIKQNLKLKCFVGLSDNAVMTQIMVAMCAYLLLAYLKFTSQFKQSLQQMIRLIRVNLFIRRSLTELFQPPDKVSKISPQMGLFYA
ncbi:MAG: IS4 family transposase [Methylotenera sp.]|nr:IS4 family transposase [Methylotenera sp.]